MNKWLLRSLYVAPVLLTAGLATADYTATQGAGTTVFAFVCSATKVCPASVLINSANTEIATAANPVRTDPTGTTTQPVTNVNLGTTADAACGTATGTCSLIALTKFNNTATSNPIPAGSNNIGSVTVANATALGRAAAAASNPVVPVAAASSVSALPAATTAVVIKASAGTLFGVQLGGIPAAPVYVKFYDSATTCSGTPKKQLIIPKAATAADGAGSNVALGPGVAFATGIVYCATLDITNTNTGAPTANTVVVNVDFE